MRERLRVGTRMLCLGGYLRMEMEMALDAGVGVGLAILK